MKPFTGRLLFLDMSPKLRVRLEKSNNENYILKVYMFDNLLFLVFVILWASSFLGIKSSFFNRLSKHENESSLYFVTRQTSPGVRFPHKRPNDLRVDLGCAEHHPGQLY